MATVAISQTIVLDGGKLAEVKHLRVCTKFDNKGVAINTAWRDANEDLQIADAEAKLIEQGYIVIPEKSKVTLRNIGQGRALKTKIVRFHKDAEVEQVQPTTQEQPAQEEAPAKKKPVKKGKKNSEQIAEQVV